MFLGTLSVHVLVVVVFVVAAAAFSIFVLVASHRRSWPKLGGPDDSGPGHGCVDPSGSMPSELLIDRSSSQDESRGAFVKGQQVFYISRQMGHGVPPMRPGTFLNFDKSDRARVDMGGYVVRRQPHLLHAVASPAKCMNFTSEFEKAERGLIIGRDLLKVDDKLLWAFISAAEEKLKV